MSVWHGSCIQAAWPFKFPFTSCRQRIHHVAAYMTGEAWLLFLPALGAPKMVVFQFSGQCELWASAGTCAAHQRALFEPSNPPRSPCPVLILEAFTSASAAFVITMLLENTAIDRPASACHHQQWC